MYVDPELWQQISAQLTECATQLGDGTLSTAIGRDRMLGLLENLLHPENPSYVQSIIDIVTAAADDKLEGKASAIAAALMQEVITAESVDHVGQGLLGPP